KLTLFRLKGDEKSKELFEFFANEESIEWGLSRIGTNVSGSNILSTVGRQGDEWGGPYLFEKGYTVRVFIHNHPSGLFGPSVDDMNTAGSENKTVFKLYTEEDGYLDFNQYGIMREPIEVNPDE
ncbi:MAG: JAB-like toxin 1 domain-containing protein, partial [Flavobacteriales bacterium]